jgi:hypothetical protein
MDPVRWDIYAMGVVAWEMLTGDVAFPVSGQGNPRQQAMQVMLQKQSAPPLDPGEKYPEGLRQLIRQMTEAKPDARPTTGRWRAPDLGRAGRRAQADRERAGRAAQDDRTAGGR